MRTDLTLSTALGTVFEGFETDARATTPLLSGWLRRVRRVVWPPACSQGA